MFSSQPYSIAARCHISCRLLVSLQPIPIERVSTPMCLQFAIIRNKTPSYARSNHTLIKSPSARRCISILDTMCNLPHPETRPLHEFKSKSNTKYTNIKPGGTFLSSATAEPLFTLVSTPTTPLDSRILHAPRETAAHIMQNRIHGQAEPHRVANSNFKRHTLIYKSLKTRIVGVVVRQNLGICVLGLRICLVRCAWTSMDPSMKYAHLARSTLHARDTSGSTHPGSQLEFECVSDAWRGCK